jgi:hypothetical protein
MTVHVTTTFLYTVVKYILQVVLATFPNSKYLSRVDLPDGIANPLEHLAEGSE